MVERFIFWPCLTGAIFFLVGLVVVRKEFAAVAGWEKVIALSRVFVAAPLALFAAEHLSVASFVMPVVPAWMPARLFVTYLVGVALLASALSILFRVQVRLAATLLSIMFFVFVFTLHAPNVVTHLHDRVFWTVALRDSVFALGALALAASQGREAGGNRSSTAISIVRVCVGMVLLCFAVEHFLFSRFVPGVPLNKMIPDWVPVPWLWTYTSGAVLLVTGAMLLLNKRTRMAAAAAGLLMAVLTLILYAPIMATDRGSQLIEGQNYVADTLLFGGMLLFVAGAMPKEKYAGAA